jgi:hypothetical protein
MSNTNTGGPAFPLVYDVPSEDLRHIHVGMTLRDVFAAKAMQASLTVIREFPDEHWRMGLALDAYATADAMLKAREQCTS